jgi:hypothetical protein
MAKSSSRFWRDTWPAGFSSGVVSFLSSFLAPAAIQARTRAISSRLGWFLYLRGGIGLPLPSIVCSSRLLSGSPATTTFWPRRMAFIIAS